MKNIRERFNDNAEEFDELVVEMLEENERVKALYNELLFAVVSKHTNETRHEAALRYIRTSFQKMCTSGDK